MLPVASYATALAISVPRPASSAEKLGAATPVVSTTNACLLKLMLEGECGVTVADKAGKVLPELVTPTMAVFPATLKAHPLACVLPVAPPMNALEVASVN